MKKAIKENMKNHEINLSKYACLDEYAIRLKDIDDNIRTPFFRDIDKILYSLSYSRYIDKTQVFFIKTNDMISRRMTHIQLVSKIARTIGRGLGLNEDLIEAASLGHDLGHVPFGHMGESILNKISLKYNEGYFNHNVQSVRILMDIEKEGKGSNVTIQVLDAILCHNGEELKQKYIPMKKDVDEFLKEYNNTYIDKNALKNINAMTLEGCVVRISDVIAYIGRDLEDAIRLNKITKNELPKSIEKTFGNTNSDIINTIVMDVLENSIGKNYICMSDKIFNCLNDFLDFNYKNIYLKSNNEEELKDIDLKFNKLFELYYKDIENNNQNSDIFTMFLNNMCKEYLEDTTTSRKVIDYISGMTDNYFLKQYNGHFS